MRRNRNTPKLALLATVLALVPISAIAQAATTYTWNSSTGGGTTDWNTAANWNPSSNIPGSVSSDNAYFADPAGLNTTVNVGASVAFSQLRFSTTTSIGYDITASPGQAITLNLADTGAVGGSDSAIYAANTTGTNTVDANITLGAAANSAQAFTVSSGGTLVLNGNISSTNALGYVGFLPNGTNAVITLTGTNSYSANSRLAGSSGLVRVTTIANAGSSGNLGAGAAIEFTNPTTLRYTGAGETTTKGIHFVGTSGTRGATIDASGAGALNIAGNVTTTLGASDQPLTLKSDSSSILNKISGNITDGNGTVSVVISTGHWVLSGNNAYTSTANRIVSGAALDINSATALGTGAWRIDSSTTIDNSSAGNVTVTGSPTYTPGSFTFTGTQNLNLGAGAVTLGVVTSNSTLTITTKTLTIDGNIGESAAGKALTKDGAGTLVLNGNNTYTGQTTVSNGTLLLTGNNSAATGLYRVNGGVLAGATTLGGSGQINSGGAISPGNGPGTMTFNGDLTLNNGSTAIFEGGDLLNVLGTLDLNNNWTLALGDGFQDGGSIVLFSYGTLDASPALVPTFDTTNLGFSPSGSLTLEDTGSSIVLHGISIVPEPASLSLVCLSALALLAPARRRVR